MSNWEKFKNKTDQPGEAKPEGRKIGGNYRCQFCTLQCNAATYYPTDSVLKYVCDNGHTNFLENFKLAF